MTERNGAEQWYDKGVEAMNQRQWDYAIECMSTAVRLSPDTLEYRKSKYRCCRKKEKEEGTSAIAAVKLVDIRRKLLQAKMIKDWSGMDKWGEAGIVYAPSDAQFFAHVAHACTEMQRIRVARYAWSIALRLAPENIDFNRAYGRFLCMQKEFDSAQKCFQRILQQDAEDRYAKEMLRYIDVERLIHKRGYGDAESTHDVEKDSDHSSPVVNQGDQEGVFALDVGGVFDLQQDGHRAGVEVNSATRQKSHHLRLARNYADQRQWDRCLDAYRSALEFAPDDPSIKEMMEDAELSQLCDNVDRLQRAARKTPGAVRLTQEAQDAEHQMLLRRIEVYKERIERYRSDMKLRFSLAEDYSKLGEYRQAIPLYQQAANNITLKAQALLKLGQCWICDGKRDLAARQFSTALTRLKAAEHPDEWKTAHYWLGRLYEADGRIEDAESHYSEVILLDYGFRDTVKRLEGLQSSSAVDV